MAEKVSLKDVLNYDVETYISPDEVALIRDTFKNNPKLLRVLRKVLLPTAFDPELPIEEFGKDVFGVGREFSQIPDEHIKSLVLAREEAIKFIMGGLISLKQIANITEETVEETARRVKKDSTK